MLVGPASVAGEEAAAAWARALGRPVAYEGGGDWRAAMARSLSGPKLADFERSYGFLARHGFATSAADLAVTTRLLGRPPRSYETYVRDTAARWAGVC